MVVGAPQGTPDTTLRPRRLHNMQKRGRRIMHITLVILKFLNLLRRPRALK